MTDCISKTVSSDKRKETFGTLSPGCGKIPEGVLQLTFVSTSILRLVIRR